MVQRLLNLRLLVAVTVLAIAPQRVAAQAAHVLLVPLAPEGTLPDVSPVADMAATTGTTLRSHDAARTALERVYGVDPPEVTESDLERWIASSRQAVRSLARADYDSARSALADAESVTDRALAELNREATRSRQVLDTCLYLVRSLEETGQHERAVEQGYACRRLVPRGEPTLTQHPPEIRALLAEVDRSLAQLPGARLRIVSEPSGCGVRLNGLDFGTTPFLTEDLRPGEYRVQVECHPADRGRVHRIEVGRGGTELRIDPQTEAILRTDPLRIVGAVVSPELVARVAHVGGLAGAREVWLVEVGDGGVYTLHRIDVASSRELGVVRTNTASLPLALASLRQGRSHDWTTDREIAPVAVAVAPPGLTQTAVEAPTPSPPPAAPRAVVQAHDDELDPQRPTAVDHTLENIFGVAALALGAGAYGAAWWLWDERTNYHGRRLVIAEPTDVDYLTRQSTWLSAATPIAALGGAGAVLWSIAVPLTFGPDHEVPAWSWIAGAMGLAGVGVGAGLLIDGLGRACPSNIEPEQACIDAGAQSDVGILVMAHAVPFVMFPITHLARGSAPRVGLAADRQRILVEARGSF